MWKLVLMMVVCCGVVLCAEIPNSQDFGPIQRPTNPSAARDILGYDKFQTQPTKSSKTVQYGNNWEQYDTQPFQFQPQYQPRYRQY